MRAAALRLGLAAALFAGWVGWLAYLAFSDSRPVGLSRPQFLASDLVVVAGGAGDPVEVTVREVVRPDSPRAKALKTIAVPGLRKCEGWAGPGTYILPLTTDWKGSYRVTPMQR